MTLLPICDPNTVHRLGEDLITFMQIIYQYIHWDQEMSKMHEIKEMLYSMKECLTVTYNTYFGTTFTKFRPFLPSQVNVLRAQIHRNTNLIYHINHKVDLFKICSKKNMNVTIQLLIILDHVKHFIAVKLTSAKAK